MYYEYSMPLSYSTMKYTTMGYQFLCVSIKTHFQISGAQTAKASHKVVVPSFANGKYFFSLCFRSSQCVLAKIGPESFGASLIFVLHV